jgi:hypothetical protein
MEEKIAFCRSLTLEQAPREKAKDILSSAKRNYRTLGNDVTMRPLWDSRAGAGVIRP